MELHEQLQHTSETLLVSAPIHSFIHSFIHKFTTQPAVEAAAAAAAAWDSSLS
jgi:hypothetical protein